MMKFSTSVAELMHMYLECVGVCNRLLYRLWHGKKGLGSVVFKFHFYSKWSTIINSQLIN